MEQLRSIAFLKGLDQPTLDALAHGAIWREYAAGEVVFVEGESSSGLYVVHSGWLKVLKNSAEGRERVPRFIGPGETFNETGNRRPRPLQTIFVTEEKNAMAALVYPDWKAKVIYSSTGPQPQVLAENEKVKVIVAGLVAGQQIPVHPESFGVYHFLEGTGTMIVDDERLTIAPGVTIITPAGAQRGIEADTALAFLATRVA